MVQFGMKKNAGDVIPLLVGWLSTGCPVLDKALHGGLLILGVTEIAGTSAAAMSTAVSDCAAAQSDSSSTAVVCVNQVSCSCKL